MGPSLVLNKLNCKQQSVCVTAKQFLDKMHNVPCIKLNMFCFENSKIKKNKRLQKLKKILFELKQIKKYLDECNEINRLLNGICESYKHWIVYDGLLSLSDCVDILSSNKRLNELQKHVFYDCDVCRSKTMTTSHISDNFKIISV